MRRVTLPGLLLPLLIAALSGCHHSPQLTPLTTTNTVGYVFLESNTLEVHHLVHPGEQLIWKAEDSTTPDFWIKFEDGQFCKEANPGDLHGSYTHPAICTVTKGDEHKPYAYDIYDYDPSKTSTSPNHRGPTRRFVQNCKACT